MRKVSKSKKLKTAKAPNWSSTQQISRTLPLVKLQLASLQKIVLVHDVWLLLLYFPMAWNKRTISNLHLAFFNLRDINYNQNDNSSIIRFDVLYMYRGGIWTNKWQQWALLLYKSLVLSSYDVFKMYIWR